MKKCVHINRLRYEWRKARNACTRKEIVSDLCMLSLSVHVAFLLHSLAFSLSFIRQFSLERVQIHLSPITTATKKTRDAYILLGYYLYSCALCEVLCVYKRRQKIIFGLFFFSLTLNSRCDCQLSWRTK